MISLKIFDNIESRKHNFVITIFIQQHAQFIGIVTNEGNVNFFHTNEVVKLDTHAKLCILKNAFITFGMN